MCIRVDGQKHSWLDRRTVRRLFYLVLILLSVTVTSSLLLSHASLMISISALAALLYGLHLFYIPVRAEHTTFTKLRPTRLEHHSLVGDILYHEEFLKLQDYHHHSGHIYDHVQRVSFIAYAISKLLSIDYHAAARGGLLHDFFLYDWREKKKNDASRLTHGKEHPHIALENARLHFEVSHREADIIVKHMFPKTRQLPRYSESFIVSLSDKIAAIFEYLRHPFVTDSI